MLRKRYLGLAALAVSAVCVGASVPTASAVNSGARPGRLSAPAQEPAASPLPVSLSPLDPGVSAQDDATREDAARAARLINAALPLAHTPLEAAAPLSLRQADQGDRAAALRCLTQAIYYEAGFEPDRGKRAVAQVVLNRVRHPAFPKTVCGVVFQGAGAPGCQFSFTCDGALSREPHPAAWARARAIAERALAGAVEPSVGQATHYHADYVAPYWAPRLSKLAEIGQHIFYRWPGGAGRRIAFTGKYAGGERAPAGGAFLGVETAQASSEPPERRAESDVGGRVITGLGWTPTVPITKASESSFARVVANSSAPAAEAATQDGA